MLAVQGCGLSLDFLVLGPSRYILTSRSSQKVLASHLSSWAISSLQDITYQHALLNFSSPIQTSMLKSVVHGLDILV